MSRIPLRLQTSDLHGLSRLGIDGVRGVADMVEHLHHAILRVPGFRAVTPAARTGGIPGLVYRSIHGVTGLVGGGMDLAFSRLADKRWQRLFAPSSPASAAATRSPATSSPERERFLAVINGVLGDHLAATDNPLAIRSAFRRAGRPIVIDAASLAGAFPTAQPRLLITAHGLCMHDGQWYADVENTPARSRGSLPAQVSTSLSCSTLDFHYNTGRHISGSGSEFSAMLQDLVDNWPVEIKELFILGHSMGGLVARSAAHQAVDAGHDWPERLKKLVFLGTPHHGSPVERAGHGVDRALGISRYSAPFTRLGKMRSAGITDLRHGSITAADRLDADRFARAHDTRTPVPLPAHVECFAVAATLDGDPESMRSRRFGDGLVPVPSALGRHQDPRRHLSIAPQNQYVATATGHLNLLHCPEVARQVVDWLS